MNLELNFLISIAVWFGGNSAIASLIALVVDLLKRIPGLVKDGTAGQWAAALNLLSLIGFSFYFSAARVSFGVVDDQLESLLKLSGLITAMVLQLKTSTAVHDQAAQANLPLLGYSATEAGWKAENKREFDK